MDDLFKKFINTGVGFLSQGNKRVQSALDQLVKESKISEQEGKKIMDDLLKSGETKRADLEKQFQSLAGSLRDRVGLGADTKQKNTTKATTAQATAKRTAAGAAKKTADTASDAANKTQRATATKASAAKKKPATKEPTTPNAAEA